MVPGVNPSVTISDHFISLFATSFPLSVVRSRLISVFIRIVTSAEGTAVDARRIIQKRGGRSQRIRPLVRFHPDNGGPVLAQFSSNLRSHTDPCEIRYLYPFKYLLRHHVSPS